MKFIFKNLPIIVVFVIAVFIRFYRLDNLMVFIGDQGWFYLSARDTIINREIPLVGITTSQTWLHQGPFWTYVLSLIFLISRFNPVGPVYFTALIGVISVLGIYLLTRTLISKEAGIFSALIFATSPLLVIHSRMPYHISLIPIFVILFLYSYYRWISGGIIHFPLVILFLSILYNLELASVVLWFVLISTIVYGALKKEAWTIKIFSRKIIVLSFLSFLIPMLPIIIYDVNHEYLQTIKFLSWIRIRIFDFLLSPFLQNNPNEYFSYVSIYSQRFVYFPNKIFSLVLIVISVLFLSFYAYYLFQHKKLSTKIITLLLPLLTVFLGFLVNGTPSEAYLPILFPSLILVVALFLSQKRLRGFSFVIIFLIAIFNLNFILSQNFLLDKKVGYGPSLKEQIKVVKEIIKKTEGKRYNIVGGGFGSEHRSFTMNYEYLAWYLGKPPSSNNERLKFEIKEERGRIVLTQKYD